MSEPIIKEVLLNAPPSKVWEAITDKNAMKQWLFDLLTDFKPEVGFEFQFKGKGADLFTSMQNYRSDTRQKTFLFLEI